MDVILLEPKLMLRVVIVLISASVVGCGGASRMHSRVDYRDAARPAQAASEPSHLNRGTVPSPDISAQEGATSEDDQPLAEFSSPLQTTQDGEAVAILQTSVQVTEGSANSEVAPLPLLVPAETDPAAEPTSETESQGLSLDEVIGSVYLSYPLLEAAFYARDMVAGQQLSAQGEFDLKFKGASENEVLGFYQNYRQSLGIVQPTYNGGEFFAGYRVGNGLFEPWYKERQTNEGGEFKAGFFVLLARDRNIDERRAKIMSTDYERQLVEPEIQAQLIGFVQEASFAYWNWVAHGERYQIAQQALSLAENRNDRMRRQVEEGFLDPPQLTDNLRLIAERRMKLSDIERKLRQSGAKLSLFIRDGNGQPIVPRTDQLPGFPELTPPQGELLELDTQMALEMRPEIALLNLSRRKLDVELAQARNELKPSIDAYMSTSQDMGQRASPNNDKGEFEMEASVFLDVPLQRRKAQGKIQSVEAKLAQLNAKRRMIEDKISVDVQLAYAGLITAYEQAEQAAKAVELATELARVENRNLELGASDLLTVTLREQFAVEAAERAVEAKLEYFKAKADYRASLGQDRIP